MAFGSALTDRSSASSGAAKQESPFISLKAGQDITVRILDENVFPFYRYWYPVNVGGGRKEGRPIIVAFNNPLKEYMNKLGEDHPEYRRPSQRAYLNVLDRTEYKAGEPANTVRILEVGKKIVERLQVLDGRAMNRQDFHKMKLQEFDVILVTIGEGRDKDVIPSQGFDDSPLPKELASLQRYDLKKMTLPMPNDAVQALLDGEEYMAVREKLGWNTGYPMLGPSEDVPF